MQDWNVVITVHQYRIDKARDLFGEYGRAMRTDYFNVLTLKVEDVEEFLERVRQQFVDERHMDAYVARIMPVYKLFQFQSPQEFVEKAREVITPWIPNFTGKTFHVRMHRRGFKGRISSQEEEQTLDKSILDGLAGEDQSARVTFDDPELILVVETIGQQGGAFLWTREERERYPFLKLD